MLPSFVLCALQTLKFLRSGGKTKKGCASDCQFQPLLLYALIQIFPHLHVMVFLEQPRLKAQFYFSWQAVAQNIFSTNSQKNVVMAGSCCIFRLPVCKQTKYLDAQLSCDVDEDRVGVAPVRQAPYHCDDEVCDPCYQVCLCCRPLCCVLLTSSEVPGDKASSSSL